MSTTSSQAIVNQSLFDQEQDQMGLLPFAANPSFNIPPMASCHQLSSLKAFSGISASSLAISEATSITTTPNLTESALLPSTRPIREDITPLLSLHRSSLNPWAMGEMGDYIRSKRSGGEDEEHHQLGVSAMKMKRSIKGRRKVREPRFCFKTMSDVDVLDDGYKWRKYGQKVVKNTHHPRSYYRCTQDNCRVKKRVERLAEDPRMVITTYEGRHAHCPSNDHEESQAPAQLTSFLW